MVVAASAAAAPAPPGEVPTVSVSRTGLGEVSQYRDGKLVRRWTGLSGIRSLQVTGPGRLGVFEQDNRRFLEFDSSGTVLRGVPLAAIDIFGGSVLSNGHLLVSVGRQGVIELDGSGNVSWRAPPPEATSEVVAAVRGADGRTLCAVRRAGAALYVAASGASDWSAVRLSDIEPFADPWLRPGLRALDSTGRRFALWYQPWTGWRRLDWKEGEDPRAADVPAEAGVQAIAGLSGGTTWVARTPYEVLELSPTSAELGKVTIADEVQDIAAAADGSLFVAVERTPDRERPAHLPPAPDHRPFAWSVLALWVSGSLAFLATLQAVVWKRSGAGTASAGSPELEVPALREAVRAPAGRRWIFASATFVLGVGLAAVGCLRIREHPPRPGMALLFSGVVLAAAAAQWWSRRVCGNVDFRWLETSAARFPRWLSLPTWIVVAVLLGGGALLWLWQSRGIHPFASVSLWVALQVVAAGFLALSRRPARARAIPWETLLHLALLLALGWILLSRDLDGVPRNVHNDVGSTVEFALRLLEGRAPGLFAGGYAEIPYPGHLPTSLGLLLEGKTVVGSRWGGMLVGLLAVLGTYALGREYRSPRLGLFAATLLLASIPFLHFSRSTPFGEVAAYSAWLLYLLLRAVRTANPGAWLLLGVVGGWGLLLFYSARVALAGVIVAGVFLALRSPRVTLRRWYGPLLFALGFAVAVVPMVPYWRSHPSAFLHRMDTSFALYDPRSGFHAEVLERITGKPFLTTLGMFYNQGDASGQGTLSPAAGPIEAALLSVGLAVVLADGFGANVACLAWFLTMLLGCGTFTEATPWFTRLVAVAPVAALFMARVVDLFLGTLPIRRAGSERAVTALAFAGLIVLAAGNFEKYRRYEHALPASDFTAFGRAALALGPRYRFACVTFQRAEFSCLHPSFLPFLAGLDVRDLRDPIRAMPFPAGRPMALMISFERFVPHPADPKELIAAILLRYPAASVRSVYRTPEKNGPAIGALVLLSP